MTFEGLRRVAARLLVGEFPLESCFAPEERNVCMNMRS